MKVNNINMVKTKIKEELKNIPILEEPMVYIYIMLNEMGKIKIGKTKDMYKRYLSLCGSNGQGVEICRGYCSPATFLHSIERIMHEKFDKYRIPNTEWFYDKSDESGVILFNKAMNELELLFSSAEYERCNETRKRLYEKQIIKGGDTCDD